MKIFDCFMYFDEDLLLEIRLDTLFDYVDKFIIVEANIDHAGNKREPQFNIKKFLKYKNKINYILFKELPVHNNFYKKNWGPSWRRENMQRNALQIGYKDCDPDDLIMISDLDEIPNPEKIKNFTESNKYGCFVQKNFLYKMNLLNLDEPKWYGTRICKKRYLKSPQWLREVKATKRPFYKFYKPQFDIFIDNGGWHFSSMKSAENIYKKLNSFAEQQYNNEKFKNISVIEKKLKDRVDLFDRGYKYNTVDIDNSYPKFIVQNKNMLKEFIYNE